MRRRFRTIRAAELDSLILQLEQQREAAEQKLAEDRSEAERLNANLRQADAASQARFTTLIHETDDRLHRGEEKVNRLRTQIQQMRTLDRLKQELATFPQVLVDFVESQYVDELLQELGSSNTDPVNGLEMQTRLEAFRLRSLPKGNSRAKTISVVAAVAGVVLVVIVSAVIFNPGGHLSLGSGVSNPSPALRIVSPEGDSHTIREEVPLSIVAVADAGGTGLLPKQLQLLNGDALISPQSPLKPETDGSLTARWRVSLTAGNHTLKVIATNSAAKSSKTLDVTVLPSGLGRLFVLVVAVGEYPGTEFTSLPAVADDARKIARKIIASGKPLYSEVLLPPQSLRHEEQLLLDGDANRAAVESAFEWLQQQMTANDQAFILLSGHAERPNGNWVFKSGDAEGPEDVRLALIGELLTQTRGQIFICVDSCFSGAAAEPLSTANANRQGREGIAVLCSSPPDEVTRDGELAACLLQFFENADDDGILTIDELTTFVETEVKGSRATNLRYINFPLAIKKNSGPAQKSAKHEVP